MAALFTKTRPLTSARSTTTSTPSRNAVEGAGDILPVDAQVQREVVPGAGRDDHERDAVPAGDRGDQGLRTVPAGHADQVGSAGDGLLGQGEEIVAGQQHDRFDAQPEAAVGQTEPLGLAAAGLRVHQQHGMSRGSARVDAAVGASGPVRARAGRRRSTRPPAAARRPAPECSRWPQTTMTKQTSPAAARTAAMTRTAPRLDIDVPGGDDDQRQRGDAGQQHRPPVARRRRPG